MSNNSKKSEIAFADRLNSIETRDKKTLNLV